jgi:succinate dehydrogenase hydrophobic anchor subunit
MENKIKAGKFLSLIIIAAAIAVIAGWVFNIPLLTSFSPDWVSMKISTAICFLLSGVSLYYMAKAREGDVETAQIVLFITTLIVMLLMGTLFFSGLLGVRTGIEDLFVKDTAGAVKSVTPGRPSFPTMLNFILMSLAAILTLVNNKSVRSAYRAIGIVIGLIGAIAITGYIIGAPALYYYFEGINSAIALNTACLFVLLGAGLLCL